jgi:ketosteroid isomerase-like protein
MSQENVELAQRVFDAVNRHDLGALLTLMDADVEAVSLLVGIEGGYHGHEGIRRWWGSMLGVFPDWAAEVVEVRDLGDLTLITAVNLGHGAGSDAPLEQRIWILAEWRDRKVVWWKAYGTETEALEAAGLWE